MHRTLRPMRDTLWIAAGALALLMPAPARAGFDEIVIDQVMSGYAGQNDLEYVALEVVGNDQKTIRDTRLTYFNADGSMHTVLATADRHMNFGAPGDSILFATEAFGGLGATPDFIIDTGVLGPSGMVCWGAPGSDFAPNPNTWNPATVSNYTDCVAYGNYSGPLHPGNARASSLPPGGGQTALRRQGDTNDDEADFTLDQVVACSNSGPCTILAVLTTLSTTTSTVTTTSTSTTTLEPVCCGDANRDGRLTSTDALAVLRGAVGLAVNLECSAVCQNPAP